MTSRRLLAHRLAQVVGLGERVPGELLRHAHHALLVDHQAVRVAEHLLGVLVEVLDLLPTVLAVGVVVVHVHAHRPGPVEREHGRDVLEAGGCQRAQQGAHRRRLELEHADRVAAAEQVRTSPGRRGRPSRCRTSGSCRGAHHRHGVGDDVEVAQAEEVHLQQAEFLDAVHLELGDDRRVLGIDARPRACAGSGR